MHLRHGGLVPICRACAVVSFEVEDKMANSPAAVCLVLTSGAAASEPTAALLGSDLGRNSHTFPSESVPHSRRRTSARPQTRLTPSGESKSNAHKDLSQPAGRDPRYTSDCESTGKVSGDEFPRSIKGSGRPSSSDHEDPDACEPGGPSDEQKDDARDFSASW